MRFGYSKETVLLSTHNICFGWEIKKIVFQYAVISEGLKSLHLKLSEPFLVILCLSVPFNKSEIVLTTMATRHTIPTSKRLHTVYGITDKTKETEYEETMPDVTRETAPYRWTIIIGGTIGE